MTMELDQNNLKECHQNLKVVTALSEAPFQPLQTSVLMCFVRGVARFCGSTLGLVLVELGLATCRLAKKNNRAQNEQVLSVLQE